MVTNNAGDSRSKDNYSRNTGVKKEYKGSSSGTVKKDYKTPANRNSDFKKKDYNNKKSYGNPYDKDKDNDNKNSRDSKSKAVSNKDSKTKEQQIGKIDIINRLEKEKKAVQKKKAENIRKPVKNVKPQVKPKRVNNIDWTKEYENDSFDDDDLDIYL